MSEFIYTYSTISHTSLKNWTVWRRMIYRNCSSGIVFRSSSMSPLSRPTADHESIGTRPSPSFAGYCPIIWWRSSRTVQDPPLDLQGIDRLYDGALAAWYKTLSVHENRYFLPVFRIWVIFRIRIELFFLCQDRDRPKIRIRSGKILIRIHEKNRYKTVSTSRPNQKHHLDAIGLLMDGSGSGFLKSGFWSAKKPGSIRIRIRNQYQMSCTVSVYWTPLNLSLISWDCPFLQKDCQRKALYSGE